jgi:hypothetical protein
MNKEILLFSESFEPKQEFLDFIKKLEYKDYKSVYCRLDPVVIDFVRKNSEKWFKDDIYKGEKTSDRLCGFLGFAYVGQVDISREFRIDYARNLFSFMSIAEKPCYKDEEPKYEWFIIEE